MCTQVCVSSYILLWADWWAEQSRAEPSKVRVKIWRKHIKIVLHYKIKGCIEVFIVLEKKWIKSIFPSLLHSPPTFYIPRTAETQSKYTPARCDDVSWACNEKKSTKTTSDRKCSIYFDACSMAQEKRLWMFHLESRFLRPVIPSYHSSCSIQKMNTVFIHSASFSTLCHTVFDWIGLDCSFCQTTALKCDFFSKILLQVYRKFDFFK